MELLKVGDIVSFSSKWLKSTQAHDLGRERGEVLEVAQCGGLILCTVQWADRVTRVLHQNLVRYDQRYLEAF